MSEFTIHTIESAPAEAKAKLKAAEDKFGFLPNLLGELAAAPPALAAYMALGEQLEKSTPATGASRSTRCCWRSR